ncbi:MAG: DNA mismatch repair endonuclease MutL [Candidatus Eremiobacteraeota bacterium]|nr:DNA mismatch repair endonuclease MutL [Candidatus Eremiobacteraeota bacterium]
MADAVAIVELDALTIGQIAAGEVIERPSSVVKELVENAVDAGARRIEVNLKSGGIDLIEVVDDGEGIAADDLRLAVRRHATSKLSSSADLESIATLGFRGEGLASIAAVSRLEILSRTVEDSLGMRLVARADRIETPQPVAAPIGTSARASSLFENVPARREYLRSPQSEFNRISAWLTSFALAYPRIAFVLRHDEKPVWTMPPSDDERERLAMVFGRDSASHLLALQPSATMNGNLRGFISAPGRDRADRRMQFLFVNGRLLRGGALAGAWTAGYATFAMSARHPYGVLFLDVPPNDVDQNVHPTKSEVRFRFAQQIFDSVRRSISATLHADAGARFREQTKSEVGLRQVASLFEAARGDPDDVPTPRLRVLTQLHRTFILATDGDGLLLVDQHAAHERIAYEAIVRRAREGASSEPLLVPLVVELDQAQSSALDRLLPALGEGGLCIESFGERAYRIVATPAGFGARPFDLAGFLADLGDEPKQRDVRERVWASLACHSVAVAGERLETDEMTMLVDRLQLCRNPMHCPHGRPTMVRLGPDELARMFKR